MNTKVPQSVTAQTALVKSTVEILTLKAGCEENMVQAPNDEGE